MTDMVCGLWSAADVPEMVEALAPTGINAVELDTVQGIPLLQLGTARLTAVVEELRASGIEVASFRLPLVPSLGAASTNLPTMYTYLPT